MSDEQMVPDAPIVEISDDQIRRIDEAGRRAGAALRSPAPRHGAAVIAGHARRRRVMTGLGATVGVAVLVVAAVAVLRAGDESGDAAADSIPTTVASTEPATTTPPTTTPPTTTPATAVPVTTTGATSVPSVAPTGPLEINFGYTLPGTTPHFSADGSLIAVGVNWPATPQSSPTVQIYDAETLTPLREFPCPVVLGTSNVPGTGNGLDLVWDAEIASQWDDAALSTFQVQVAWGRLCGASLSSDGRRAVVAADVTAAAAPRQIVWDTSDGSLLAVVPGSQSWFGADDSLMVASTGPSMSLWNTSTGTLVTEITDDAAGTAVSADGTRLLRWSSPAEGSNGGVVATVYDTQTLSALVTLSSDSPDGIGEMVEAVFDAGNEIIATRHVDGVSIWDVETGEALQHVSLALGFIGGGVGFTPDGGMFAVAYDGRLRVFDAATGEGLADVELVAGAVAISFGLVFSPNGYNVAVGLFPTGPATSEAVQVWFYDRT